MQKINVQTLVSQAESILEDLILNGKLKSGERIKEQALEKELGISRTPLREALMLLQANGLIETIPHKGRFVKKINIKEISDICDVRIALEALAVRLAHKKVTPKDITILQSILDDMSASIKAVNSTAFIENHERFHEYLISLTGNAWLEKELHALRKLMRWHRFYFRYHEKNFTYSLKSHQLQLKMLSDPNCNEDELVRIDQETTRRGCDLLIEHINSMHKKEN